MRLIGKKVAILMESDFCDHEPFYYQYWFPKEGAELIGDVNNMGAVYAAQDGVDGHRANRRHCHLSPAKSSI